MNISETECPRQQEKKWLTVKEASEYTGLARSTLYELVCALRIPHYRPGGLRVVRFDRDELDAWMRGRG